MNWMLAAILICGANMVTSCSLDDNPVDPEPEMPDQVAMFVQNVLSDTRYKADKIQATSPDGASASSDVIRLDVSGYDEALEEFLKLLPEGVAETAFEIEDFYQGIYSESVGYRLNDPANGGEQVIALNKVRDYMSFMIGYAWVQLTPELQEILNADFIVYMPTEDEDDMSNFVDCLMKFAPYCQPDMDDMTHLICTFPTYESYLDGVLSFLSSRMMMSAQPTEEGDMVLEVADNNGNLYGLLTVLSAEHRGDALNVFLLDEDLQASLASRIGISFSKISFYVSADAEIPF